MKVSLFLGTKKEIKITKAAFKTAYQIASQEKNKQARNMVVLSEKILTTLPKIESRDYVLRLCFAEISILEYGLVFLCNNCKESQEKRIIFMFLTKVRKKISALLYALEILEKQK